MTIPEPDLVEVQIIVNITFDANGEDHEKLRANAYNAISREFNNGGITGGSDAVVDSYDFEAKLISPKAIALDEEKLESWLASQIEDGHMELGRLPLLMARYALADSTSMREEFAERMAGLNGEEDTNNATHKYLSCEGWGHCFVGSTESRTRWVIDRNESILVHAQVISGGKWTDMSEGEAGDLAESLSDNDVLLEPENYTSSDALPDWVAKEQSVSHLVPITCTESPTALSDRMAG